MDKRSDEEKDTPTVIGTHPDSTSIDSLSIEDTWESTNRRYSTQEKSTEQARPQPHTPTSIIPIAPENISPTVTNITRQMETDISETIRDIRLASDEINVQDSIRLYIDSELTRILEEKQVALMNLEKKSSKISQFFTELYDSKTQFQTLEDQYKKGSEKIHSRLHWINAKMNEYESKFSKKFTTALEETIDKS